MFNKRLITLVLVLAIAVGMVVTPKAQAKPDKLKVWASAGDEEAWMKKMADKYEAKTGIKIKVTPVGEKEQSERLGLDGPAGKGADVIGYPHDELGRSVIQGLLEPLGQYLPDNYAQNNYLDNSVEALTYNDKLYGLPYAYQTTALVYNKRLLPEVPDTFNDLIKKAKKLTNEDKDQYGFLYDIGNFYYTYGFLSGYDGYIFGKNSDGSYNAQDIGLANQGSIKGMKLVKRFRTEGLIPKGITYNNVKTLFGQGKVGAIIDGPWSIKGYKEAKIKNENIGVAPLPKLENGKYPKPFLGVKGYYLSKFSKHKEAAAKFIKFLTNAENSMDHFKTNNIIAPHNKVVSSTDLATNRYLRGFVQQARNANPMPSNPEMMQVWQPMGNAITFVLKDKVGIAQIMPQVVSQIKASIRQMKQ